MKNNTENQIRSEYKKLKPYVPIEPTDVLSKRINISPENIIKLDGNENPYGCSPQVIAALGNYQLYNIYPDPEQRELLKALSNYTGMNTEYLIAGAGSDELIELILKLFLEPGDKVINCPPTFGMYRFCTEVCAGTIINVNRTSDFSITVKEIKKQIDKRTKVIFLASPNNPSGNLVSETDIMELLDTELIVAIDEAYGEFSGVTYTKLVPKFQNLVILRTFSKWAGLAGLRVGYGIFRPNIIQHLMRIKQPYNINIAAQIAALESLKDIKYLNQKVQALIKERERLFKKLSELEWLHPFPSQANFILCSITKGNAKQIHATLQRQGIFIRYFDTPELQNYIRISVGKPEHTDKIIIALKNIR